MAHELIYTSAERGLRPGTRGYCTVAYTRGMMPQTLQLLEALSVYKSMYGAQEAAAMTEPVSWSHYKVTLLGRTSSVLSRISPNGVDHTNRSNKLAHHILITLKERPAGGPLWLSSQDGMFIEQWEGNPRMIETPKALPQGDETDFSCNRWKELTGDAGYAGMLASTFHATPDHPVYLAYEPGMDMFGLLREAMALLPPDERWNVTYNTYFTNLPAGVTCVWRCCVADSEALRDGRRNPKAIIMDLTKELPPPADNDYVRRARTGEPPPAAAPSEKEEKLKFKLLVPREINQLNMKPRNS
ncbi:MAG: hypothetical protein IKP58_09695 [Victivallales bacterium]|nr:hypothetical protein [Victivallales bacterium]